MKKVFHLNDTPTHSRTDQFDERSPRAFGTDTRKWKMETPTGKFLQGEATESTK